MIHNSFPGNSSTMLNYYKLWILFNYIHNRTSLFNSNELLQIQYISLQWCILCVFSLQILCGYYFTSATSAVLSSIFTVLQIMFTLQSYMLQISMLLCCFCWFNLTSISSYSLFLDSAHSGSNEFDTPTYGRALYLIYSIFIQFMTEMKLPLRSLWIEMSGLCAKEETKSIETKLWKEK